MRNYPTEEEREEGSPALAPGTHPNRAAEAPQAEVSPAEPRKKKNRTPKVILILVLAAAAVSLIWWKTHQQPVGGMARPGGGGQRGGGGGGRRAMFGPLPVVVSPAAKGSLNIYLNGLGTVIPLANVTLRTQISGQLMQVNFTEGQMVAKGDLLAVIDPRPYQVALEQAQGQIAQAQAQLLEAQVDLTRYQKLATEDSIAKQQVDSQMALVNQYQGLVQADQAAIDNAKLNLTYCHITAPVDGRVGLRQVDAGNYVTPGDANGLVVLTQIKPITVIFTLPEDSQPRVAARLRSGAAIPIDAYDRTLTNKIATGTLATTDNQADTTTGTFKLRAVFPNADESLFPNQFVNIKMLLDVEQGATIIPTSAIERGQDGDYVYVAQPDSTVMARPITIGPAEGERVIVLKGLNVGDQVVVDGADKLKDGMAVAVQIANASGTTSPAPGMTPGARSGSRGAGRSGGAPGGDPSRRRTRRDGAAPDSPARPSEGAPAAPSTGSP